MISRFQPGSPDCFCEPKSSSSSTSTGLDDGCCDFLPASDLPGSVTLTGFYTAFDHVDPVSLATLYSRSAVDSADFGPFVYHSEPIQFFGGFRFPSWGGTDVIGAGPSHTGSSGYYIAGPACLKSGRDTCRFNPLDATQPFCSSSRSNRRYYVALACTTVNLPEGYHPDAYTLAAQPRVRLFVASNYGQHSSDGTYPDDCDDHDPTGEDPPDHCYYDDCPVYFDSIAEGSGASYLASRGGGLAVFATTPDDPFAPFIGAPVACDQLCYVFDSPEVDGTIGGGDCTPLPAEGCWTSITVESYCPEECPSPAQFASITATDTESDEVFGPAPVEFSESSSGDCLSWRATVNVRVPFSIIDGEPETRSFALSAAGFAPGPVGSSIVSVVDCQPVELSAGLPPSLFQATFRLTGCAPDGDDPGLETMDATVKLTSTDGATTYSVDPVTTAADGTATAILSLPPEAGSYKITVTAHGDTAPYSGYAETIAEFSADLPAAGTACHEVDLGDIAVDLADDWVCTCAGPAPETICWTSVGHGGDINLTYNAVAGQWEGIEQLDLSGSDCPGGPGAPSYVPSVVTLKINDDCSAWEVTRKVSACFVTGPCTGKGSGTYLYPSRSLSPATEGVTTDSTSLTPWGPSGDFEGGNFQSWEQFGDDEWCEEPPPAGYADATFDACGGGAGLMAAVAPRPPEPTTTPDPAPTRPPARRRIARSAVAPRPRRSAIAVAIGTDPRHPAYPVLRAKACPERRPCDCQHVDCGFWGRKVPARQCLACPIKERYLPPPGVPAGPHATGR